MAYSTQQTVLTVGETNCLIKEFPDMGSAPSGIDVTNLSDTMHRYVADIPDTGDALEFTSNFDKSLYGTLDAMTTAQSCTLTFPDGSTLAFSAEVNVFVNSGGVGDALEMTVALTPTTAFTFTAGA